MDEESVEEEVKKEKAASVNLEHSIIASNQSLKVCSPVDIERPLSVV